MKQQDIVYAFMYCGMIYESSYATISLHRTRKGAEMAMEFHKAELKKEWDDMYKDEEPPYEFGHFEAWAVEEVKIYD